MSPSPESIVSGRPYTVIDAAGGPVGDNVAVFLGPTEFTIGAPHEKSHLVIGIGSHDGGSGVRFYEKDQHRHGGDVRIWQINPHPDGGFTACHQAAI